MTRLRPLLVPMILVAACAAPVATPDASRTLSLRNGISQVVLVSVSERGGSAVFETVIRPCGGTAELALGREIPVGDGWLLLLAIDPSGRLDADSRLTADLDELDGNYSVDPIWSRGDIPVAQLPAFLTITPSAVKFPDSSPRELPAACDAWPVASEP